ncbi:unnamed protein product [Adineta steineri]|uniref:Uncharacterized protein n=1 Tax=Adineta steineri TaxID=433720 RepID=A0A814BYT6_9BILA|nr:unnamed protein product [Adineta steineri]CAF1088613.1 unnamed protein product [Adineta steineri]CAF1089581.1 unnamed protein product [Adineta steineri]CAF1099493.1 unnamed protein product [Adineta steineri]CAF1247872.1 unnamed protein product [Adineta steineri]
MSTNTLVNENLNNNNSTLINDGPIAHLDHMLNSLHDEQQSTRIQSNVSIDSFDNKSHRMNHRSTPRTTITDGKIVECSSENAIVYRYYTGESSSVIDEHFDKALKQPISFNSTRTIPTRDPRTSSYGYSSMMSPSSTFWPNFMASPTSYPHPTYLPTSQNEYTDWMHHHHTYRLPYSTNPTATTPSSSCSSNMSSNHLHPIGSPNNTNNNNNNNNTGRYHHHTPPDMDVVTAAAIGAAAAAQMFHNEKQSHHGYTPTSHHFDYHLGGSMMATASYAFPTQSFDLMGTNTSSMGLENPNIKDSTASPPWYSNHHLSC